MAVPSIWSLSVPLAVVVPFGSRLSQTARHLSPVYPHLSIISRVS